MYCTVLGVGRSGVNEHDAKGEGRVTLFRSLPGGVHEPAASIPDIMRASLMELVEKHYFIQDQQESHLFPHLCLHEVGIESEVAFLHLQSTATYCNLFQDPQNGTHKAHDSEDCLDIPQADDSYDQFCVSVTLPARSPSIIIAMLFNFVVVGDALLLIVQYFRIVASNSCSGVLASLIGFANGSCICSAQVRSKVSASLHGDPTFISVPFKAHGVSFGV